VQKTTEVQKFSVATKTTDYCIIVFNSVHPIHALIVLFVVEFTVFSSVRLSIVRRFDSSST